VKVVTSSSFSISGLISPTFYKYYFNITLILNLSKINSSAELYILVSFFIKNSQATQEDFSDYIENNFFESGYNGGEFYKAWEIILNNPTIFEPIFLANEKIKVEQPKPEAIEKNPSRALNAHQTKSQSI
jgi:hypothetical protein